MRRRLLAVITAFGAVGLIAATFWITHTWWKTALTAIGCALLAFAKKVWGELEPEWAKKVAAWINSRVSLLFDCYHKEYTDYLYYKHRIFDVKGFSTQGKFALELENVYVELTVDPALAGDIPQDPIRLPPVAQERRQANIFVWLRAEPKRHGNFSVVGPPGSGKTTLLKHLALVLAASKGTLKLTPLLLILREHAAAIEANAEVKFTELIEASLKSLPPPPGWFERLLKQGKCLVMLDGLDEVANSNLRCMIVRWVERQIEIFGANRFLVTSRPNGYRNNTLAGFTALRVLPFSQAQVEKFIRNWYLANEVAAHQKDAPRIRIDANKGADDLLARLHGTPALQQLGVNPLLLTLIATVHRYRSELPSRRVELFAEICDVFLGKRQQARGQEVELSPAQKIRVLRVLAYHMMCHQVREIAEGDAARVITEPLRQVMPESNPSAFLQMVEDSSGLLVQEDSGIYGFIHLTFQEYLASVHIKEEKLVTELAAGVNQPWWQETARLYSAQADASPIIESCLASIRPDVGTLLLATDCEFEALKLREDLRERLHKFTEEAVEDLEPELRRLAAEHMLARRIRDMWRVDEDYYVDTSPVTHAEYQLFIDERRAQGQFRQPEHWNSDEFPKGAGRMPVLGIRKGDAVNFCAWLSDRMPGKWSYSLPEEAAVHGLDINHGQWQKLQFFTEDGSVNETTLPGKEILERIRKDTDMLLTIEHSFKRRRALRRLVFSICWYVIYDVSSNLDRGFARASNLALDRTLDRTLARDFDLDFDLDRDRGFVLDLALDIARDIDRDRLFVGLLDVDCDFHPVFDLVCKLARDLANDMFFETDHATGLPGIRRRVADYVVPRDRVRALALFAMALNDLCVAERRAEGTLPISAGLWLIKNRQNTTQEKVAVAKGTH